MAQPLRKIRQRIAPAVPKGGFSFTLPPLAAGAVCIVMLACIGYNIVNGPTLLITYFGGSANDRV
mgnify:CR=1 FL=1